MHKLSACYIVATCLRNLVEYLGQRNQLSGASSQIHSGMQYRVRVGVKVPRSYQMNIIGRHRRPFGVSYLIKRLTLCVSCSLPLS